MMRAEVDLQALLGNKLVCGLGSIRPPQVHHHPHNDVLCILPHGHTHMTWLAALATVLCAGLARPICLHLAPRAHTSPKRRMQISLCGATLSANWSRPTHKAAPAPAAPLRPSACKPTPPHAPTRDATQPSSSQQDGRPPEQAGCFGQGRFARQPARCRRPHRRGRARPGRGPGAFRHCAGAALRFSCWWR